MGPFWEGWDFWEDWEDWEGWGYWECWTEETRDFQKRACFSLEGGRRTFFP